MPIKSLTIYCSSSENLSKDYYNLGEKIGTYLAKRSIKIIYGGGKTGLMGKISESSNKAGGEVIGIIPKFLMRKEKINKIMPKIGKNAKDIIEAIIEITK